MNVRYSDNGVAVVLQYLVCLSVTSVELLGCDSFANVSIVS